MEQPNPTTDQLRNEISNKILNLEAQTKDHLSTNNKDIAEIREELKLSTSLIDTLRAFHTEFIETYHPKSTKDVTGQFSSADKDEKKYSDNYKMYFSRVLDY
eukprot:GAHX01001189.1.p1 GENE.GAHX01001189.1~~GAHX01001189.1.p1  ORF type:complete len:102 (+),score=25.59 GAHX01001189.1:39-344(+)